MRKLFVLLCLLTPIGASAMDTTRHDKWVEPHRSLSTVFLIGQQVATLNPANVRQTAAGAILGSQPAGAVATVVGGPISGTLGGTTYVWWNLNFTSGVNGWVASDNLVASGGPPPSLLNSNNTWLAGQAVSPVALTFGATVTPDAARSNDFTLTATDNFLLANPVNLKPGQTLNFWITQDGAGHRVAKWGSAYQAPGGPGTLLLSTQPNAKDFVVCQSDTAATLTCSIWGGVR